MTMACTLNVALLLGHPLFISITYKQCVYCAVRAESLNTNCINLLLILKLQVSQLLAQLNNDCCEGRERQKAADRLLWGAVCQYCSLTVWLVLERSSGGGFVSGGTAALPFLKITIFLSHTHTHTHTKLTRPSLSRGTKVLGKNRKRGNINCILYTGCCFFPT